MSHRWPEDVARALVRAVSRLRTPDLAPWFRAVVEDDPTPIGAHPLACDAPREGGNWAMPQLQLPIFPPGLTSITEDLAFEQQDGKVVYFHGALPVYQHDQEDLRTFRMWTSQLIANGTVRQRDIARAFGVPLATVKRYVKDRSMMPRWILAVLAGCVALQAQDSTSQSPPPNQSGNGS